ncbi:hypothetical protein CI102_6484 [Trichoderma harzianum]|nr:hypothetical protein CI102_6484 [Trichoderma harzianum]
MWQGLYWAFAFPPSAETEEASTSTTHQVCVFERLGIRLQLFQQSSGCKSAVDAESIDAPSSTRKPLRLQAGGPSKQGGTAFFPLQKHMSAVDRSGPGVRALLLTPRISEQVRYVSMLTGWRVGFLEPYAMQGSIARQSGGGPLSQPSEASNATSQAWLCSALWFCLLAFPRRFTRGRSPRLVCFFTSPPSEPPFFISEQAAESQLLL